MIWFLFLFGLALGPVSPSEEREMKLQRGNCPMFWFSFNGRCYKYIATRMSWADAELHCVSERANLVSIHSLDEQNFVKSLIKSFDPAQGFTWIGLSDTQKEGRWMWSDGCAVKFTSWNSGEPNDDLGNEDCAHKNFGTHLKWNDKPCSDSYSFVCASRIMCPYLQTAEATNGSFCQVHLTNDSKPTTQTPSQKHRDSIMILFLFLLGLTLGTVPPSAAQNTNLYRGNCPVSWVSFNNRCYKYFNTRMTWADAEHHCVTQKANLVSVHSLDEQIFIKFLVMNFESAGTNIWLGLSDIHKEGRWMWSDGSAVNFVFWSTGEPNDAGGDEDCVHHIVGTDLKWNDITCSQTLSFVCTSRPVCP
ncbi:C-type mannose receptor 2-like [Toxotes jaculatrix]|uniref:C-type mannose receptor 2-like n=1 Tax=Toxotes jaculatrix TaxID=941984 RepID=UPI001B3AA6CB|nr:C-type mannose receptor 2-like [Toxotes jaculatrix]